MKPKVKVFVSYHKPAVLLKSEVLIPVWSGKAAAKDSHKDGTMSVEDCRWMEENLIGDDTGENISYLNRRFNEITTQYFAWKNSAKFGNPDYIGFMHYRRHLNFNEDNELQENIWGTVDFPNISENYINTVGLTDKKITEFVKHYDIVTTRLWDVRNGGAENIYSQYKNATQTLDIKDYETTMSILLEKYPEYRNAIDEYNNNPFGYFTNIFIMKKELFEDYCEWLFTILRECEKQIPNYSDVQRNRAIGQIAERLFGIYITYLKKHNPKIRIKELQRTYVQNTNSGMEIPVVFSCDDKYCQHLYCAIKSIAINKIYTDKLHIYILSSKMNDKNRKRLNNLCESSGMQLSFIKVNEEDFCHCPQTEICKHISVATYYRFLLASLLNNLDKVLYLDCDITVKSSLSDLYNINIADKYFGAVQDILYKDSSERMNLEKYCNAGVMLINLKKWREDGVEEKFFDYVNTNQDLILWQDQDVLNDVLQNGICYIDKIWNAQVGQYELCYTSGFNELAKQSKIVHHIGFAKPWDWNCLSPQRNIYFKYLLHTPYGWKVPFYFVAPLFYLLVRIVKTAFYVYMLRKSW